MLLTTQIKEYYPKYAIPKKVMENPSDYENKSDKDRTTLLKRIPLHRLMDLKIDYAFKQLFGNEKNKEIMIVFLNAILQKTGHGQIKDVTFSNIEAGGEYVDDKQSRLDLLVITNNGKRINVEIQFSNKYDMVKRSIYYWAGVYRRSLKKRMVYRQLPTVISINILNFPLFKQTERFHTTYHLYEDKEKFLLTNTMEFHYIEMNKLLKAWQEEKLDPWNDILARWLLMLGMVDHRNDAVYQDIYRQLEEIAMKDETLRKAFENWEELSMTEAEFHAYEGRLKQILDEENARYEMQLLKEEVEQAEQELKQRKQELEQGRQEVKQGRQELEQGRQELEQGKQELEQRKQEVEQQKREIEQQAQMMKQLEKELREEEEEKKTIALRLLTMGMAVEDVAKATDLSIETVLEIQKEV